MTGLVSPTNYMSDFKHIWVKACLLLNASEGVGQPGAECSVLGIGSFGSPLCSLTHLK